MKIRFIKRVDSVQVTTTQLVNGQLEVKTFMASYEADSYLHNVGQAVKNGNGTIDISMTDGTMVSAVPADAVEEHNDEPTNVDVQPSPCNCGPR